MMLLWAIAIFLSVFGNIETTPATTKVAYKSLSNVDIVFLMDGSGSVKDNDMEAAVKFMQRMTDKFYEYGVEETKWSGGPLKHPVRIGLVRFSNSGDILMNLAPLTDFTSKESINSAINGSKYNRASFGTYLGNGLDVANQMLQPGIQSGRKPCIILISDGGAEDKDWYTHKKSGTFLASVGVGAADKTSLKQNTDMFVYVTAFNDLEILVDQIATRVVRNLKQCLKKWTIIVACHGTRRDGCTEIGFMEVIQQPDKVVVRLGEACETEKVEERSCTCPSMTGGTVSEIQNDVKELEQLLSLAMRKVQTLKQYVIEKRELGPNSGASKVKQSTASKVEPVGKASEN